jgi:acetoin utilization deacetylase AcuC-like enzyme
VRIPVVYSQLMVAESGHGVSPSSMKPALVAQALRAKEYPVDFIEPEPATIEDLQRVHEPRFVQAVLEGREDNGFGNRSLDLARTFPYTSGSLLTAAKKALGPARSRVVASLSSGFHHATWNEAQSFCTFNGLMVTCANLIYHTLADRIAIIDVDYHYGNGTDDILAKTGLSANVFHLSFGKSYSRPDQSAEYLERLRLVEKDLERFQPNLILYSAGADTHIEDPLGGLFTEEQMGTRDQIMFEIGMRLNIPVVFNLAGGYQRDASGGISKVVKLHLNTFSAALRVHGAERS